MFGFDFLDSIYFVIPKGQSRAARRVVGDAVEQEELRAGSGCCRGAAPPAAP